jgi:hypothetical protein
MGRSDANVDGTAWGALGRIKGGIVMLNVSGQRIAETGIAVDGRSAGRREQSRSKSRTRRL